MDEHRLSAVDVKFYPFVCATFDELGLPWVSKAGRLTISPKACLDLGSQL